MVKLSVSKAWDETSQFLAKETRLVAPVALAMFLVPTTLLDWAMPGNSATGGTAMLTLMVMLALAFIGQMTIAALATGWRGSVGEAIGKAVGRVPAVFATLLIVFMPIGLIVGIVLAMALAGAGLTDAAQMTPEAIAKLGSVRVVFLLSFAVIMVIAARLLPLSALAINERPGPIAMIKRSWTLTKGNVGRLTAITLLLLLGAAVLGGAVQSVVGTGVELAIGPAQPFSLSALLIGLAGGLTGAIVSAVSAVLVGRIYAQLAAESPAAAAVPDA